MLGFYDMMARRHAHNRMGLTASQHIERNHQAQMEDKRDAAIMLHWEAHASTEHDTHTSNPEYYHTFDRIDELWAELDGFANEVFKEQGHTCADPMYPEFEPACRACEGDV